MIQQNGKSLILFLTSALLSAAVLSSCHLWTKGDTSPLSSNVKKIKKRQIEGIGTIVSIHSELDFVLIDVRKPKLANQSNSYYIERKSRAAVLKPTGEKIGRYYAADIINGEVKLDDPVFIKLPKPPPEPEIINSDSEIEPAGTAKEKLDGESTTSEIPALNDEVSSSENSPPSTSKPIESDQVETASPIKLPNLSENNDTAPADQLSKPTVDQIKE